MSKLERILEPGSRELPDCVCGSEMHLARSESAATAAGVEARVYECADCGRQLRSHGLGRRRTSPNADNPFSVAIDRRT